MSTLQYPPRPSALPLVVTFDDQLWPVNVAIAVFQELRARRKLEQIALLAKPTATVVRDGAEVVIDPAEVVGGTMKHAPHAGRLPSGIGPDRWISPWPTRRSERRSARNWPSINPFNG